jgi:hypothetical protein
MEQPQRTNRAFRVIALLPIVLLMMFLCNPSSSCATFRYLDQAKETNATMSCQYIVKACKAYRDHPASGGQYPEKLALLLRPSFVEGVAFLETGERGLIDPWGNPFKYALVVRHYCNDG